MSKNLGGLKNVVMLVQNLPVPFDRRVWMEATTLKNAGYEVTILCPGTKLSPKLYEVIDGIKILRFPLPWEGRGTITMIMEYAWSVLSLFTLVTCISFRKRIAVIHICNPPDLLFLCALPAKIMRRSRIVFDQHDLCPEVWQTKKPQMGKVILRVLIILERMTYAVADKVISTNQSYKEIAMSRGNKRFEDVCVVRSAPALNFLATQPKISRDCTNDILIGYLGTMGSQEGIDLLLRAIKELKDQNPRVKFELSLVGDGPERISLERLARDLEITANCKFYGRVSDVALREIIGNCDLAINPDRPSKFNSMSSMNKIIEYMALGVPIVQFSSVEGEFTASEAAVTALESTYLGLANTINMLRMDTDKRNSMQAFAMARFRELSWESQEEILLGIYLELSDGK